MNNWIEVSEERLAANYRALGSTIGAETEVLAVIKANAYGHGAVTCAPMLARAGAKWMGVTNVREGVAVRRVLLDANIGILVMSGFLPEDALSLVESCLTPVIWTSEHLQWLGDATIPVHIEVDTGMSRQGAEPGLQLDQLLDRLATHPGLSLNGIFTHFCSSEVANSGTTIIQESRFAQAIEQVRVRGLKPAWVHAGNTSTVDNPTGDQGWLVNLAATVGAKAMVRNGLGLYGYCLPIEPGGNPHVEPALQPVMTWKTRILSVRDLAVGESVGYNSIFTATQPTRIALLPVGYADGLRRELSSSNLDGIDKSGGWAIVAGQRAPILGRVSMNLTVVDITRIPSVRAGDGAVVLGDGVTAEDHARLAHTIAYEILCGIHPCG